MRGDADVLVEESGGFVSGDAWLGGGVSEE
jgi:hypothetical protein